MNVKKLELLLNCLPVFHLFLLLTLRSFFFLFVNWDLFFVNKLLNLQ